MLRIIFTLIITITLSSPWCFASSFRCGGKLVSVGETAFDVLMKCQKPDWIDEAEFETIRKVGSNEWQKVHVKREIWLYNFGPNAFMRELVVENDRVIDIKSLGYGYQEDRIGAFANVESKLYLGMSKSEAFVYWGAPSFKTSRTEERFYKTDEKKIIKYYVTVTEWIYNFGSRRIVKTLLFENNRLTDIKAGDYGYDH